MKPGNRRMVAAVPIPTEFLFCKIRWSGYLLSCRKGFFYCRDNIFLCNKKERICSLAINRFYIQKAGNNKNMKEGFKNDEEVVHIRIGYRRSS
jgi:hypothetical protein